MRVFVDTSAFFAVLDADDDHHTAAGCIWSNLINAYDELHCSNYVLLETFALLQRRLGMEAVRAFQVDVVPLVSVHWVDEQLHASGIAAMLTAGRQRLSLVDCSSFELMRRTALSQAFAFDEDFDAQGFSCVH